MVGNRVVVVHSAHGGCLDEYLTDQVIVFMALAKGTGASGPGRVRDLVDPLTPSASQASQKSRPGPYLCTRRPQFTTASDAARHVPALCSQPLALCVCAASLFTGAQFKVTPSGERSLIVECNGVGLQPPAAASQ